MLKKLFCVFQKSAEVVEKEVSVTERQVAPMAKQPLVRLIPEVKVEVAPVTERFESTVVPETERFEVVAF